MKRIINFSGGKSSALMTILEYNPETDYVIFCDTGREHEKTYKFINDFEAFESIPIIRLKLGGENLFKNLNNAKSWLEDFKSGKIIPEGDDIEMLEKEILHIQNKIDQLKPFDLYLAKRDYEEIPNMMKRSCTIELKVKVARRWARKNIGMAYDNLLGFRADEPQRVMKNKKRWQQVNQVFPLFDKEITKEHVNQYWLSKPYNLEIPSILGNCTLCFMKGKNNIINILRHDPKLADQWIEDERKSALKYGHTYLKGITIEQCLEISQMPDLFSNIPLENLTPAYNCSCSA